MTAERIHAPQFQLYKESTIPWAPVIPNHWETKRAKSLFKKMERPVRESDEVVTCFRDGTVTLRRNRRESGFTESLKEIGYQGIRPGDLVIHAMDAFAGAIGVSDSAGKGTPVYSVCTPIGEANPLYYAHALREMSRNKWIESLAKGIRERSSDFRFTEFSAQAVPVPPPEEQAAIVRFLDHADEQIQRYIAGKKRLIALLEEERQALVHQAVTQGLDPNVRLKPSGVEWLGEVPEHWEIKSGKWIFEKMNRPTEEEDEVVTCFRDGTVTLRKNRRTEGFTESLKEIGYQGIRKGDLVIHQMDAFAGAVGVSDSDGKGTPVYSVCKPNANTNGHYYSHVIREMARKGWISALARGVRERSSDFRYSEFARQELPVPPFQEQNEIADFLHRTLTNINEAEEQQRKQITIMNEYRTQLTADVVTGQLDVREAATQLQEAPSAGRRRTELRNE